MGEISTLYADIQSGSETKRVKLEIADNTAREEIRELSDYLDNTSENLHEKIRVEYTWITYNSSGIGEYQYSVDCPYPYVYDEDKFAYEFIGATVLTESMNPSYFTILMHAYENTDENIIQLYINVNQKYPSAVSGQIRVKCIFLLI